MDANEASFANDPSGRVKGCIAVLLASERTFPFVGLDDDPDAYVRHLRRLERSLAADYERAVPNWRSAAAREIHAAGIALRLWQATAALQSAAERVRTLSRTLPLYSKTQLRSLL